MSKPLNIAHIWNEVAYKENRPLVPRDYLYASELGGPMYDRFLKMKGVQYTNPPNQRSLRKFLSGNIWEYVVKQILLCTGVFRHEEIVCNAVPFDGLLGVHGRIDYHVGGVVNMNDAMARLQEMNAPEYLYIVAEKIINAMDGIEFDISNIELKSCSSFAMDKLERTNKPLYNNASQAFYYAKASGVNTSLVYVCKDDNRMKQFDIDGADMQYNDFLKKDIEQISYYYNNNEKPPLEPLVKFTPEMAKFEKNFGIEYSPYLAHYGFETPEDYRDAISYIDSWNRVLERYFRAEMGYRTDTGKPIQITDKNKAVKQQMIDNGIDFNYVLECKIKVGADETIEQ